MSITIGIGKNLKIAPSESSYESEITAYIAGLSKALSSEQLERLNILVRNLKSLLGISMLSEFFDAIYVFAGETQESSLRNLVKRYHDCVAYNAPTWVQYEGFTNSGTSYLNANYNPNADAVNFALNDAALGVYSRTDRAYDAAKTAMGCYDGSDYSLVRLRTAANAMRAYINQGGYYMQGAVGSNSQGLYIATRRAANEVEAYKNCVSITEEADASTNVPNRDVYILALNNNGSPLQYETCQIAFAFASKGVTDDQQDSICETIEAYMDALGKGVMP